MTSSGIDKTRVWFSRRAAALAALLLAGVAEAGILDEMWEHPVELRRGVTMRALTTSTPRLMKAYVVCHSLPPVIRALGCRKADSGHG